MNDQIKPIVLMKKEWGDIMKYGLGIDAGGTYNNVQQPTFQKTSS